MAILAQVAITTESTDVGLDALTRCSAAIQKQVTRDFAPIWQVDATADAFARLEDVPLGYWPVIVMSDIHSETALGYHVDQNKQPFALVKLVDGWETTVSHETLEMLADPFGNRLVSCPSIKEDQGRVQYLVEVCDPSEGPEYGYTANGILVSDFYTPHVFDPEANPNVRYSFTGAITRPREVLKGGYLSWYDPVSKHAWQQVYWGDAPEFVDRGDWQQPTGSLREFIDSLAKPEQVTEGLGGKIELTDAADTRAMIEESSVARAEALRAYIPTL